MKKWYLVFAVVQLVGCALPQFANLHSNPAPLLLGLLLTFPGSLLLGFIPHADALADWEQAVLVVLMNFIVWAVIAYWIKRTRSRAETP
jgi:hypothetical protein